MGPQDNLIPEDKLPKCWSDDVRMNALFAPFRVKSANPESWDMKMKFWSDMLRQWCKHKSSPLLSASDAKFAFQRKGRTPACIDIVVEEMLRNGDLTPTSKYQHILHNGPEGWVRWGARLAFRPAAFALTAVSSLLPARQAVDNDGLPKASIDPTQTFVLETAVKEQATTLLESYPSTEERIGTVEQLMSNSGWQGSRETFDILLGWLVEHGYAVKSDDVVKLGNSRVSPVSESERALVRLRAAETRLSGGCARLARDVAASHRDARAAAALGDKAQAKNHLRKKLRTAQRLDKCEAALDNVRHLIQQIRDVDVNAAIMDSYKTSSEAMKNSMKESGLSEDAVHDTIDDLNDVMSTFNEVEKALSSTIDDADIEDLESELQDLLTGPPGSGGTPGKEKQPVPGALANLPSPPKEAPGAKKREEREFVFDGEERVIAELNELSVADTPTKTDDATGVEPGPPRLSAYRGKPWYPLDHDSLFNWNNNDETCVSDELRQDNRLHPGQPLQVDFNSPPVLYGVDFQVQDHKMCDGLWFYNRDTNSNDLEATSIEYSSSTSPGKADRSFVMAPGGERRPSQSQAGTSQS